jgi:translocator protein
MRQKITSHKIRQILVIIATLAVIFVNYLAGTGKINNLDPKEISDKYINFLTPAGYAFAIWGLIYLGLICFSFYQALPAQTLNARFQKIRPLYIASCAANIAWIYAWHYDQILISLGLMIAIFLTILLINRVLYIEPSKGTTAEIIFTRIPFGIYFGWITAATILNVTIALIYMGVTLPANISVMAACAVIGVATMLAIAVRRGFDNILYPLTVAWALIAIAIKQQSETAIFATGIIGAIISVISIFFKKKFYY